LPPSSRAISTAANSLLSFIVWEVIRVIRMSRGWVQAAVSPYTPQPCIASRNFRSLMRVRCLRSKKIRRLAKNRACSRFWQIARSKG
jgi:hypothetical protein